MLSSVPLGELAWLAAAIVAGGIVTGILAAYFKDGWIDTLVMTIGLFGISMPAFFFGIVMLLIVSVWLGLVPVVPRGGPALFLPALTLGLIEAAPISRLATGARSWSSSTARISTAVRPRHGTWRSAIVHPRAS